MFSKQLLLSVISLLCLSNFTQAQNLQIKGKITDASNSETLVGASVVLQKTKFYDISNSQGQFELNKIPQGRYLLQISFIGYEKYSKEIELGKDLIMDVSLTPAVMTSAGVVVRGTKAKDNTPTTFQNIGAEEIAKNNKGREINYLMESTPSVVASSDAGTGVGYSSIRIRGVDDTRINVSVNGIPLNNAESHQTYMVNMPDLASSVSEIGIQRGVGSSINGSAAFGASINFQTTQVEPDPYASYNGTYGSFNTLKNTVEFGTGLMNNAWAFDGRLSQISSDGYVDRASADLKSYYVSGGYYGKKNMVKFVHFRGKEITYSAWDGVPKALLESDRTHNSQGQYEDEDGNIKYYKDQKDNYDQSHYQLFYAGNFGSDWTVNAALHYTKGYGYYEQYKGNDKLKKYGFPDSLGRSDLIRIKALDNDFYGLTASASYNVNTDLQITLGGGINQYDGRHFGELLWLKNNPGIEDHYEWYRSTGFKTDGNIYLKANYQIGIFNLFGDIQYRHIDYSIGGMTDALVENKVRTPYDIHKKYPFFNPKLGVSAQWTKTQSAYLSVAIANREPNRDNFTNTTLYDQMPKPERLYDAELGYKFRTETMFLHTNLYFMYYQDQLALTGEISNTGEALQRNVPQSYRAGIEASFDWLFAKKWKWSINATFSQNKILNYTDFVPAYNADYEPLAEGYTKNYLGTTNLALSPSIIGYTRITYKPIKQLEIFVDGKLVGRQYIDNTSNTERSIDPYFINNLTLSYTVKLPFLKELNIWASAYNFANVKYETNAWAAREYVGGELYIYDGYFPQAGISFMAGLNLKF